MGRPKKDINFEQLKALMRLKPTLKDAAAFFECHTDTIVNIIKRETDLGFSSFRDQNMVHTRFSLIRKAIQQAENGNTAMMIFCLKNLCGWADKKEVDIDATVSEIKIDADDKNL